MVSKFVKHNLNGNQSTFKTRDLFSNINLFILIISLLLIIFIPNGFLVSENIFALIINTIFGLQLFSALLDSSIYSKFPDAYAIQHLFLWLAAPLLWVNTFIRMQSGYVSNYLGLSKARDIEKNMVAWLILAVFVLSILFIPLIFPIETGSGKTALLNNSRLFSGLISYGIFWVIGVVAGLISLVIKRKFEN